MTTRIHLALLCASAIAIAFLVHGWRSARHDSEKLAATLTVQDATIRQANEREKQRDVKLGAALASIQSQTRAVHTAQQAAKHLPEALLTLPLPVPIPIEPPPAPSDPARADDSRGDSRQTTLSVPQADLLPLYNDIQDCRASKLEADSLQQDLSDEKARSAALLRERNAAQAAARGGTPGVRLKRATKWFAVGIVAGAALASANRHRSP
jgi:hypothetical protein